jgi:hypothetical protein
MRPEWAHGSKIETIYPMDADASIYKMPRVRDNLDSAEHLLNNTKKGAVAPMCRSVSQPGRQP